MVCRPARPLTITSSWEPGWLVLVKPGRAREALEQALALAEAHRLNTWYFKIEKELEQLSQFQGNEPHHQEATQSSRPAVVEEVMVSLREYAAAAEA